MKEELKNRLFRNLIELKNTNLFEAKDEFLKDGDITHEDEERVSNEITTEDKNRKLVQILATKPDAVFAKILNWLTKAGHKNIVKVLAAEGDYDLTDINKRELSCSLIKVVNACMKDKGTLTGSLFYKPDKKSVIGLKIQLENTVLNAVDQNRNDIVVSVLEKFEIADDEKTEPSILVDSVNIGMRYAGEYMDPSQTSQLIKKVLQKKFPTAELIVPDKRERRCVIKNLRTKQLVQEGPEESENGTGEKADICAAEKQTIDEVSSFTPMTVNQLIEWLEPVLKENNITTDIISKFRDQEVNGKAFEYMTDRELEELVPDLKWGKRKNILIDRDKEIKKSKSGQSLAIKQQQGSERVQPRRQDCLRSFGTVCKLDDKYVFGAEIADIESRITDKILPIKKFAEVSQNCNADIMPRMVNEMVKYASACMNERTNGTIHYGISESRVEGIKADPKECSSAFTDGITNYFFAEQLDLAMRCIRPPQFIPVINSKYSKMYVVEVDIVPASIIVRDEAVYLRNVEQKGDVQLFRINNYGDAEEIKGPDLHQFMKEKSELTHERELAENRISRRGCSETDLRVALQEFLCRGEEHIDAYIYPLLFISPPDRDMNKEYLFNNFEFIKNLDARAIFDFDHRQCSETIASSQDAREEVFMTKIVDYFDDERDESKKKEIQRTLDDIKNSAHKTWIYCNGFELGNKVALNSVDWPKQRTKAFREVVSFYREQIPSGRARVIILLLSKDFEVLSEAVREIELLFQNQWIVLAANESIATTWKDTMLKLHPTCFDKTTLDSKCLVGTSWQLLNETIIQFTEVPKAKTTEIPTAKRTFHKISERVKKELCDIHILSRNECENEIVNGAEDGKHKQKVEEDFYRGLQVTWWNFFYQGQALIRKDHRVFLTHIHDALNGQIEFGKKIAKAVIYHQPGAGGTTSARQVLWDLRQQYPCCLVERITDQTADQIQKLRTLANDVYPKPPVILLDNIDDEDIEKLLDKLLRTARDDDSAVFCLILICSRQVQQPFDKCPISMTLKHELTNEDIRWFEEKSRNLQESFDYKSGINPKFLIAFNIMKSNFNKEAIQNTVKEFVDAVYPHEREMLLYLSLVNGYDIEYQPLPASCFDAIMCKYGSGKILGKGWEQRLGQPIRVLLNKCHRILRFGGTVLSFRLISPLLAKEVLKYLMNLVSQDLAQTAKNFFDSKLFKSKNAVNSILFKCAASLLKKRRWVTKKEGDGQEKPMQEFLAPLLQEIYDSKNASGAVEVVELGFHVLGDPMVAQQAARLHMELRNIPEAEIFVQIAISLSPNNSFLYHTYGTLIRTELKDLVHKCGDMQKTNARHSLSDAVLATRFARKAIEQYQKAEETAKRGSHGTPCNPFGLTGILETVIYLLDVLVMSDCFPNPDELHRFLTQSDYTVSSASVLEENMSFLKNLHGFVDSVLVTLESDLSILKNETRTEQKNIKSFEYTGSLEKIQINLNQYFGENLNEPPKSFNNEQKATFRRCRVRTLNCFSLVGVIRKKISNMSIIQEALNQMKTNIGLRSMNPFDYMIAISCILKLECTRGEPFSRKTNVSEVQFEFCQNLSKCLFEYARRARQHDREANLLVILLNWPQSPDQPNNPVNHDMLHSGMKAMLTLSVNRSEGRVQMPLFYIGNGRGYDRVVFSHSLKLSGAANSKNPLRSKQAFGMLKRFEGMVTTGGKEVSVKFQVSNNPRTPTVDIPLDKRVSDRTMWNKKVYFVVGLGMSGIFAYDITVETPDTLKTETFDIPKLRQETSRKQTSVAPRSLDVFSYQARLQSLQHDSWYVREQIKYCQHLPQTLFTGLKKLSASCRWNALICRILNERDNKRIELQNQLKNIEWEMHRLYQSYIAGIETSANFV